MIGPEGYLHRWTVHRTKFGRVCSKISSFPKRLVKRSVDHKKIHALLVLGFVSSLAAPDELTLKEESRALQRLAARLYNAISTPMLMASTGLGVDVHGIHIIGLASRFRGGHSIRFWRGGT